MMRPSLMSRSYVLVSLLSSRPLPGFQWRAVGLPECRESTAARWACQFGCQRASARMVVTRTRVRIPLGHQCGRLGTEHIDGEPIARLLKRRVRPGLRRWGALRAPRPAAAMDGSE